MDAPRLRFARVLRYMRLRIHHRAIDNARFFSSARMYPAETCLVHFSCSKSRIAVTRHIHRSEYLDIHCSYTIIIRTISTAVTDILMNIMMTIFFLNSPTFRTSLRSIIRFLLLKPVILLPVPCTLNPVQTGRMSKFSNSCLPLLCVFLEGHR